jgi:uncharacterized repeat protein (TIGR01451 family)
LTVSYVDVSRYESGGPYTFQAVLTPHGTVTLQYREMLGDRLDEATIGIQNQDGSEGLTVAHNEEYVHDGLAVRIQPPASPHEVSFQARLRESIGLNSEVSNTALLTGPWVQDLVMSASVQINHIDLEESEVQLQPPRVLPGQMLTCTVSLRNSGNAHADSIATVPVPALTTYLPGSATEGAMFREELNEVHFEGEVPPGGEEAFSFIVSVDQPLADGTSIAARATIEDRTAHSLQREDTAVVTAPDLSDSRKQAHTEWVMVGQVLTYTVNARNDGSASALVVFSDPLPEGMAYVDGSAWAGSGSALGYDGLSHTLQWQGVIPPRGIVTLRFAALPYGLTTAHNVATLTDSLGVVTELSSTTEVHFPFEELFFPVMHNYEW